MDFYIFGVDVHGCLVIWGSIFMDSVRSGFDVHGCFMSWGSTFIEFLLVWGRCYWILPDLGPTFMDL